MKATKVIIFSILMVFPCIAQNFRDIQPVSSVSEFDDVRWKDLRAIDANELRKCISTLTFNEHTLWPKDIEPLARQWMRDAMVPPLSVRKLHEHGITGEGVCVAIIDQPLLPDHPEFKGKIVAYHDTGCDDQYASMHGPAVTSLLVGDNCGTAPKAKVYYAAVPSWKKDAAYYAKALDWILTTNNDLPPGKKIRLVSVSAAPSGQGSPFTKNNRMWDQACTRAAAAGILVLDCSENMGFIGPCYYDCGAPDNLRRCRAGFPGEKQSGSTRPLCAPCSLRTTAEQYEPNDFGYQYYGRGGLSWAIPYTAGIFALAWQVKPDYTAEQLKELLIVSAYPSRSGGRIINPWRFIQLVRSPSRARKALDEMKGTQTTTSQSPVGAWESVDLVSRIEDFLPGQKTWPSDLPLKSVVFREDGTVSTSDRWGNGRISDQSGKFSAEFVIKEMNGRTYMFFPWLSGDVTMRGMKPKYYVLEKIH